MSNAQKQEFSCLLLLHLLANEKEKIHFSMVDQVNQPLEPFFKHMENQFDWLRLDEEQNFILSTKGQEAYEKLVQQHVSYQAHFEIYAYVDLGEGVFADPDTDLLDDERWEDLRVAVAEHKKMEPYRIVFLAMLADDAFFQNPDWKFDMGTETLFDEMESLTREQLGTEDLAYEDEDGNLVSGEDVLEDVIEQGSRIARERFERKAVRDDYPEEEIITTTVYHDGGGWGWR
jgi:hypothetical protein